MYRHHYPDIIEPLLSNIIELLYGLKLKISVTKKIKNESDGSFNEKIVDLIKFPNLNSKWQDYKHMVDSYLSTEMQEFLKKTLDDENVAAKENYR